MHVDLLICFTTQCRYLAYSLMYCFLNTWQAAEACQLKLRSIGTKPEHLSEGSVLYYH